MSWEFFDFQDQYFRWVDTDEPTDDFKFWVTAWLVRIQENPHSDAVPADGLGPPWWFVQIPHAEDATHAVVCLYSIDVAEEKVRCSGFSTLRKPIIK